MVSPMLILSLAWTLSGMTGLLGAKYYVANLLSGSAAALQYMLPVIIFLVAVFLAFATGTSWGTFSILIPIVCHAFPEGEMLVISIAACLSGAVCGDHCSPISDTTIMASAGAHCSHVNHVSTQLPYAITAASCAAVCYVITGIAQAFLGANGSLFTSLILLAVAIAVELVVLSVIRVRTNKKDGRINSCQKFSCFAFAPRPKRGIFKLKGTIGGTRPMLEQAFQDVYTKFKLHFYQNIFQRFATREATLTTVESFCMEGIMAMGEPTIAEFSRMMQISTPNAAYKIGSLVKKGYVEKDPVHHRPARVSPAPHPEVYRLLQHQLFLPAHCGGARKRALLPRGLCKAGGDAHHCEHRADARVGYAQEGRKGRISNKRTPGHPSGSSLFPLTSALYLLPGSCPSSTAHRR